MTTDTTEKGFENLIVSAMTRLARGAGLGVNDRTTRRSESGHPDMSGRNRT